MAKKRSQAETVRDKLRAALDACGMTQEAVGLAMGYSKGGARQAVSRLLNPDSAYDPRLSTLLSFAAAIKKPLKEIL